MKAQIIVREVVEKDMSAIVELWKEMMDFHAQIDKFFSVTDDGAERFAEYMKGNITDEKCSVLVAEDEKGIVGYCLAKLMQYPPVFEVLDYGELSELAISGNYRRNGIGEALFKESLSWFEKKGIRRLEVRVAVRNDLSTAFWRKMGFSDHIETLCLKI